MPSRLSAFLVMQLVVVDGITTNVPDILAIASCVEPRVSPISATAGHWKRHGKHQHQLQRGASQKKGGACKRPARHLTSPCTCARGRTPTMQLMLPPWREPTQPPELMERAVAVAVYSLPLADGFEYGGALYRTVPGLHDLIVVSIAPIVTSFHSFPFSGLIYFLALSFFVSNSSLSRFIKFNIQQALFLDMVLLLPLLFPEVQNWILHVGGPHAFNVCRLTMFGLCTSVLGYATLSNLRGELPDKVLWLSSATNEYLNLL
uniref:Uncharacterized protein n=1 Tax=Coccolithus braarudii TaxID=221442 RepID=A0A7S0L4I1_9EUKA